MTQIFFSYSHKDEELRDELEVQLSMLKRQGAITGWHDRRILAGDNIDHVIHNQLELSEVVLLLVSPDFLASPYCYDVELTRAIQRSDLGMARTIPVILRPCDWKSAPFSKLKATPKDGKPITMWTNRDEAFLNVVEEIRSALPPPPPQHQPTPIVVPSHAPGDLDTFAPRSSNLRVSKTFTDRDKAAFLRDSFEYIGRYFSNSIGELSRRDASVHVDYNQVDANHFETMGFLNGNLVSECAVFVTRMAPSSGDLIGFSRQRGARNGLNETLRVDADEQSLFLSALGMWSMGNRDQQKLTMEGGAELFWSMFFEPFQRRRT